MNEYLRKSQSDSARVRSGFMDQPGLFLQVETFLRRLYRRHRQMRSGDIRLDGTGSKSGLGIYI